MTRVASAVVLGAILLVTIWWLPWWATVALAALAAGLAGVEVAGLATSAGAQTARVPVGFAAATVAVAFACVDQEVFRGGAIFVVLLAIVVGSGLLALASGPPSPAAFTRATTTMMAPVYTGLPLGALAWIAGSGGPEALTWLIVVIAASDSAQYYSGRAFGRHKLAPMVSPAKTIEGAVGGLIGAALVATIAGHYWLPAMSVASRAVLGLLLAAFGMAGDLFESLLKRSAGVKDSSNLIPGHGGVLDRLDAYLFAAPVFFVVMRLTA